MRVDALAIRLRPRSALEAADLGVRLCQAAARSVYSCFALVAVPVMTLALAASDAAPWLPLVALWWVKPWLDRTILFVLARAAFDQPTTPSDLWRAQLWAVSLRFPFYDQIQLARGLQHVQRFRNLDPKAIALNKSDFDGGIGGGEVLEKRVSSAQEIRCRPTYSDHAVVISDATNHALDCGYLLSHGVSLRAKKTASRRTIVTP